MNSRQLAFLIAMSLLPGFRASAAVVDIPANSSTFGGPALLRTTMNGTSGSVGIGTNSRTTATVRVDDVLDVATILSANSTHGLTIIAKGTRSFQTGPPNFPNPNPTFVTYTEELFIDTFTLSGPTSLATTTQNNPITGSFNFSTTSSFSFPDFFTITGTYKITGPTSTASAPINVRFNRVSSSPTIGGVVHGNILVGSNYPSTARIILSGPIVNPLQMTYAPELTTLYDGVVDGVAFKATYSETALKAFGQVPEPASCATAAVASLVGIAINRKRRRTAGT